MTHKIESLGKLAEALSKAQGQMKPAVKDSINPHFRSNYAGLAACWAAIREPLSQNGLALTQFVNTNETGVEVATQLMHVSGEFIRSELWLPVAAKTPQAYGSAITYARRYSLSALVGLSAEDDDGNAASAGTGIDAEARHPTVEISAAQVVGEAVVPFGKLKGQGVSTLDLKSLKWYAHTAKAELNDPSKANFHAKTHAWLSAVEAEIDKRENSTS